MRIVLQRVKRASVKNNNIHHSIKQGYCLLVGFGKSSTEQDIETLAKKIVNARLFEDDAGKLNLNLQQVEGEILSISQFTLFGTDMEVEIINDGPVTIIYESQDGKILWIKYNPGYQNIK